MQISSLTSARDWQIFKWPKQGHRLAGDDRAQQECEACSLFSSLPLKRQTHHDQSWTNWCRFDYLSIPDLMPSTPDLLAGCLKPVSAASTHAFDVFSPSARDAEVQRHVEEARDRLLKAAAKRKAKAERKAKGPEICTQLRSRGS